jgi:CheY-like chemotaxis protein
MPSHPIRVLLVEDHAINQTVLLRLLGRLGCECAVAEDGVVALEMVAPSYALVLMDCSMPRMDGWEATQRIRALPGPVARLPIVALTAHATPADRARCLDAGMNAWLTKPIVVDALVDVLRTYTCWTEAPTDRVVEGVLDPVVVQQLLVLAGPDDPAFLEGLLDEFDDTIDRTLAEARTQQSQARPNEVRRTLHRLKSASATVGTIRLTQACARFEASDEGVIGAHGTAWLDVVYHEAALARTALRAAVAG